MNNAATMRFFQAVTDFDAAFQRLLQRHRPFAQTVGQSLAFEVLHDEIADSILRAHIV